MNQLDATLVAGLQICVVGTHMQTGHGFESGQKVQQFACHHSLPVKDNRFGFVGGLAQGHHVFGQLGAVLDTVPGLQPSHGLGYQCV